jgi:hypothetical protein
VPAACNDEPTLAPGAAKGTPCYHVRAAEEGAKAERSVAAVYTQKVVGHRTTSGEKLDLEHLTAAYRRLPFGTIIDVTNRENGRMAAVPSTIAAHIAAASCSISHRPQQQRSASAVARPRPLNSMLPRGPKAHGLRVLTTPLA